jgi:methylase of polypeptide subunit release factors
VKGHYSNDSKTIATLELHILDLGTGSVAIGIALAKYFPINRVVTIDHSPMELEMAMKICEKSNLKLSAFGIGLVWCIRNQFKRKKLTSLFLIGPI